MTGRTHDLAAFTALTIAFVMIPEIPQMTVATAIAALGMNFVGGLFPDIDQPTSDFWDNFRLGPFVAKIICPMLGGHRHISHSFLGLGLIGFFSYYFFSLVAASMKFELDAVIIWQSFMIGVVSHILIDMPTKAGVPLLWPLDFSFGIPPFKWMRMKSGTWIENFIVFPSLLMLSGYLLYTFQDKVWLFAKTGLL